MNRLIGSVFAGALVFLSATQGAASEIRLVVQITVDGLRGDLLSRYVKSFGDDGFRRLMEGGVWYTDAHHLHANTETIVGHATLASGAHPSEHGMIGNAWFDRASGRLVYNIEDADYPLLPVAGLSGTGAQVDPAQAISEAGGRSPVNLLATTFGDELFKSNNGRSKVIGISGKDRSAVAMGGHVGKAFWMSTNTGAFETSSYYYSEYPQWVADWNAERKADSAAGTSWTLSAPLESYLLGDNDDRPYEADLKGFGRTFPHPYGTTEDGLYYTQVLVSPLGDELTADFARAAVQAEDLGADGFADFLGVSFSGVDATNHFFGPSSLENEEMVRRLDRTLADFFAYLDQEVGREHVLYVLSADHGMPEIAEYMAELGLTVERLSNKELQEELDFAIATDFGVSNAIRAFFRPYIYLDDAAIAAAGANRRAVERLIVEELAAKDGIAIALPTEPFADQADNALRVPIMHNFHPQRSGDIYVAQAPYSFLLEGGPIAVMHGSPWRYDSHVPILFSGPGIEPAKVSRRVATVDVAVTLSNILGTTQPSGAAGRVLPEVTGQ